MEHPVYEEECFKIRFKNRRIKRGRGFGTYV